MEMTPTDHKHPDSDRHEAAKQAVIDRRYLRMAEIWAENSYCQRRKVGAIIVKNSMIISDGFNGTPSGFENVCEDEAGITKTYFLAVMKNMLPQLPLSKMQSALIPPCPMDAKYLSALMNPT